MPLTSRDLSPEVRAQLVRELFTRLGWAEYDRLVHLHGENGLLDLILAQMEQQARSSAPSRQPVDPSKVGLSPLLLLLFVFGCFLWGCAALHHYLHPQPPGGPEGIQWENFNWAWYWKILLGIVGIALDFLALGRVAELISNRTPRYGRSSSALKDPWGCLGAVLQAVVIWQVWACGGAAFLTGIVAGPILLVWGIVDLLR